MLGGMPARNAKPVPAVHAGNVFSIAERFIKGMDYLAVDNLDIENIALTDTALVGRLASFIWMKYYRLYCDLAVADGLDFDLDFVNIRICPIQSFHNRIIICKRLDTQAPSYIMICVYVYPESDSTFH